MVGMGMASSITANPLMYSSLSSVEISLNCFIIFI